MSEPIEKNQLSAWPSGWHALRAPARSMWEHLLRPHLLAIVALLASSWWMLAASITHWTSGEIAIRSYPWSTWVDRFFLSALFVAMLAHFFEKSAWMVASPKAKLPVYPGSQSYKITLQSEQEWEHFCAHAKQYLQQHFVPAQEPSPGFYWAEQGTLSLWGSLFVLLGGLVILLGFLLEPYLPTLRVATQFPLFGIPWLAIGTLLRWKGKVHSTLTWHKTKESIHLSAYSQFGWTQLEEIVMGLQAPPKEPAKNSSDAPDSTDGEEVT